MATQHKFDPPQLDAGTMRELARLQPGDPLPAPRPRLFSQPAPAAQPDYMGRAIIAIAVLFALYFVGQLIRAHVEGRL